MAELVVDKSEQKIKVLKIEKIHGDYIAPRLAPIVVNSQLTVKKHSSNCGSSFNFHKETERKQMRLLHIKPIKDKEGVWCRGSTTIVKTKVPVEMDNGQKFLKQQPSAIACGSSSGGTIKLMPKKASRVCSQAVDRDQDATFMKKRKQKHHVKPQKDRKRQKVSTSSVALPIFKRTRGKYIPVDRNLILDALKNSSMSTLVSNMRNVAETILSYRKSLGKGKFDYFHAKAGLQEALLNGLNHRHVFICGKKLNAHARRNKILLKAFGYLKDNKGHTLELPQNICNCIVNLISEDKEGYFSYVINLIEKLSGDKDRLAKESIANYTESYEALDELSNEQAASKGEE